MPPEFNPSFPPPDWGWWIVLYFFAGGITGGVYFAAAWLDVFGDESDRLAMRLGQVIAFPLLLLCAVFLIVDLGQPLRFWHMIFQSENFPLPIFKPYSPMSFGSGLLAVFGLIVFISFVDAAFTRNSLVHRPGSVLGKIVSILGALGGLALASYTGAVLNVSNIPVWTDSPWISALFLFSGISTGIAALLLVARRGPRTTLEKLSEADNYMMLFELLVLIVFLASLGAVGAQFIFGSATVFLFVFVVVLGLLVPLVLHWRPALAGSERAASIASAVLVLVGGFVLRWAVLAGPQGIRLS